MRKHDVKQIHLKIDNVRTYQSKEYEGFCISWSSDIGFGEYNIYKKADDETNTWHGDSECMDINEDKAFLDELMRIFVSSIQID